MAKTRFFAFQRRSGQTHRNSNHTDTNAGEGAPSGVEGNWLKRFSVQRKMAIVARLLRGEPLDLVARKTNVSVAKLTEWRERALEGAASASKERDRSLVGSRGLHDKA